MDEEVEGLAPAKAEPFAAAFKAAVNEEFGTARELAKALGTSEGNLSQFIDPKKEMKGSSLTKILSAFSSPALQERVHAAWVNEYAPLPESEEMLADPERLLGGIHALNAAGNPVRALALARRGRDGFADAHFRQRFSEQVAQISLRLTRPGEALEEVKAIERRAREAQDPGGILTALWMKGNVLRHLDFISAEQVVDVYRTARDYALNWRPKSPEGLFLRRLKLSELDRDHALHVLALASRHHAPGDLLARAQEAAERAQERALDETTARISLEIRARVECASGLHFKAEETLDELHEADLSPALEMAEKTALTWAKVRAARGETDEAAAILRRVSRHCFGRMDLHHTHSADRLLAKLLVDLP